MSKNITINLGERSYPIVINRQSFDFSSIKQRLENKKILIVSNQTVAPLYLQQVSEQLSANQIFHCILPDGENYKNIESFQQIIDTLATKGFTRNDCLLSLGGGVIGDLGGFAAAAWMRGIDFIQVPTTLLAQIDASVGGKTGFNHRQGKNLIGAFHQPIAVIINTASLDTLPSREFCAGIGEAIKYGLINQPQFFKWLQQNQQKIKDKAPSVIIDLVAQCCRFKAEIVEQDETESGIRALLNLGHSFAHAIETAGNYQQFLHGEAVAIGMVMAATMSHQLKLCNRQPLEQLYQLLEFFDLPSQLPKNLQAQQILELMRLDKKVIAKQHRLILLNQQAQAFIAEKVNEADILSAIKQCSTQL